MKEQVYSQHELSQEQMLELEMNIRHNMQAGHREFQLYFGHENSIDANRAFRFLRLMKYDVCFSKNERGIINHKRLIVKI